MLDNVLVASRLSKGSLVSTRDNPFYYGCSGRKSMRITGVRIQVGTLQGVYYGCSGRKMDVIRRVSVTSEPKA